MCGCGWQEGRGSVFTKYFLKTATNSVNASEKILFNSYCPFLSFLAKKKKPTRSSQFLVFVLAMTEKKHFFGFWDSILYSQNCVWPPSKQTKIIPCNFVFNWILRNLPPRKGSKEGTFVIIVYGHILYLK